MTDARPLGADEATFIAAVRSGATARFALITERHRRELRIERIRGRTEERGTEGGVQAVLGGGDPGSDTAAEIGRCESPSSGSTAPSSGAGERRRRRTSARADMHGHQASPTSLPSQKERITML
jgi:hypothetical protein